MTPEEVWSGHKPSDGHQTVFGCNSWAYIPKEKRRAMDMLSKPCIFVGCPKDVKGYRLLHFDTHELLISMSVRFDERPPQHLVSSYGDASFELTAPTHENDLEEQSASTHLPLLDWGQRRIRSSLNRTPKAFMASVSDPKDFHEVHGIKEWDAAMKDKHNSLLKNYTWDLVPLPKGRKFVQASGCIKPKMQLMVQ